MVGLHWRPAGPAQAQQSSAPAARDEKQVGAKEEQSANAASGEKKSIQSTVGQHTHQQKGQREGRGSKAWSQISRHHDSRRYDLGKNGSTGAVHAR